MPTVDLHTHSVFSDGELTPTALIQNAASAGLHAVALTDHDTLGGLPQAEAQAKIENIELVRGIELTTYMQDKEFHILGLLLDAVPPETESRLLQLADARKRRAEQMVHVLRRAGLRIAMSDVLAECDTGTAATAAAIGRPHIARALVKTGDVPSFAKAFKKWLAPGRPAHVPKLNLTVTEAVKLIHSMSGLAILAHPGVYKRDQMIPELIRAGIDGIEAWHCRHNAPQASAYAALAQKHGLPTSGGSDFHGPNTGDAVLGCQHVPAKILDQLKRAKNNLFS